MIFCHLQTASQQSFFPSSVFLPDITVQMQNNNKFDEWPTTFFFLTKMCGQAAVKRDSVVYDVAFDWNKKK